MAQEEEKKKPSSRSRTAKGNSSKKAVKTSAKKAVKPTAKRVGKAIATKVAAKPRAPKAAPGTVSSVKVNPLARVPGFERVGDGSLLLPSPKTPVPASKMKVGLEKAQTAIKGLIDGFSQTLTEDYSIKEIEFSVSFSADGKFLGFGVGGETSITVKIAPTEG